MSLMLIEASAALERAKQFGQIVLSMRESVLVEGIDYGVIPGTNKPSLLKPGAEKMCSAFGLQPEFEQIEATERWDDEDAFFHYRYRCRLIHIESGMTLATGIGSCNSKEGKYGKRWVYDNEAQAMGYELDALPWRQFTSRMGRPYRKYQVKNDAIFDQVNTIDKMAQKRALIAAVLIGTNASEHFTQDVEDMPQFGFGGGGEVVEGNFSKRPSPPPSNGSRPSSRRNNPTPTPKPAPKRREQAQTWGEVRAAVISNAAQTKITIAQRGEEDAIINQDTAQAGGREASQAFAAAGFAKLRKDALSAFFDKDSTKDLTRSEYKAWRDWWQSDTLAHDLQLFADHLDAPEGAPTDEAEADNPYPAGDGAAEIPDADLEQWFPRDDEGKEAA